MGDPRRGRATAQLGSSPDGQDQPSNGARRLATSALGTPGHGGPGHLAGSTLTRQRTDRPGTLKACGDISDSGLLLPEILTPDLLWFRDAISETLPART